MVEHSSFFQPLTIFAKSFILDVWRRLFWMRLCTLWASTCSKVRKYRITEFPNKRQNIPFNVLNVFKVDNKDIRTTNIVLGPMKHITPLFLLLTFNIKLSAATVLVSYVLFIKQDTDNSQGYATLGKRNSTLPKVDTNTGTFFWVLRTFS